MRLEIVRKNVVARGPGGGALFPRESGELDQGAVGPDHGTSALEDPPSVGADVLRRPVAISQALTGPGHSGGQGSREARVAADETTLDPVQIAGAPQAQARVVGGEKRCQAFAPARRTATSSDEWG